MASIIWTGGNATDAKWSRTDNWDLGRAPLAGDDLHFAGSTRPSTNNDLTADQSYNSITFDSGAASFTLAGNRITLAGPLTNNDNDDQTISLAVIMGGSNTIDAASGNIILTGTITGSSAITKNGSYSLTMSGTNTFTSDFAVNKGTVVAGSNGSLGSLANYNLADDATAVLDVHGYTVIIGKLDGGGASGGNVTLGAGVLKCENSTAGAGIYSGVISGTGAVWKQGSATQQFLGLNTYTGVFVAVQGIIVINTIKSVGGGASSLGAPANATAGTIEIQGFNPQITYIGTGDTTDRILNFTGGAGTFVVLDQAGSGNLKFTSAPTYGAAGTKSIVLQGSTAGTGEFSGVIANNGADNVSLSKLGTGTWIISSAQTYTGTTTNIEGILQLGNAGTTGSLSASSAITVTSPGILAIKRTNTVTQGTDFAATINGTGQVLQSGSGPLNMNGNNAFSGGFIHNGGIVTAVTDNNAMGLGSITIGTGAVRFLITDGLTLANAITIDAGATGGSGRGLIENTSSGNATLNGAITINAGPANGGHFANNSTGTLTLAGVITSASSFSIRKGIVVLSGGGTGYTAVSVTGILRLGANDGIATTATVTLGVSAATGTLSLNGYNQTLVAVLKGGNPAIIGNISTSSNSTLTTTGTYDYAGVIQDVITPGNKIVSLVINGGVATLSGANTYTGTTTVTSGTLLVNGSISGAGAITVSNTATLGGTGTVAGAISQSSGSIINPGNGDANIGTLNTANVTMNAGSTYKVDLNGTTPTFDKINSSGTVACAGTLTINSLANPAGAKVYTIIGAGTVSGTFSGLSNGTIFKYVSRFYKITYSATTVTLTDVSNWFLLAMKNMIYNTMQNINGMR